MCVCMVRVTGNRYDRMCTWSIYVWPYCLTHEGMFACFASLTVLPHTTASHPQVMKPFYRERHGGCLVLSVDDDPISELLSLLNTVMQRGSAIHPICV